MKRNSNKTNYVSKYDILCAKPSGTYSFLEAKNLIKASFVIVLRCEEDTLSFLLNFFIN